MDIARRHALTALAAAALFGAGVPFAGLLLGNVPPQLLAGLLYLGAGVGLLVCRLAWSASGHPVAFPSRAHWPALAGAVVCGGMLAPLLLLWGLPGTGPAGASLLLNTESMLTALLAVAFFGERVGGRVWSASLLMLLAGAVLAWAPGAAATAAEWRLPLHSLAIVAACLLWGLDNNLTRLIRSGDAVSIAMVKGLVAGSVNLAIGIALAGGPALPPAADIVGALLLGSASYGASLALYVTALRHLGSARTGAYFAIGPFFGALIAVAMGEAFGLGLGAALALSALAVWLMLTETHRHRHAHERLQHAHPHAHDEHHRHAHVEGELQVPHEHEHEHEPLTHSHDHTSDLHHRHGH